MDFSLRQSTVALVTSRSRPRQPRSSAACFPNLKIANSYNNVKSSLYGSILFKVLVGWSKAASSTLQDDSTEKSVS